MLAPRSATLLETIELIVQIKLEGSPPLSSEDWPIQPSPVLQTGSASADFTFPVRHDGTIGPATLLIKVIAPKFRFESDSRKSVIVPAKQDSPKISFMLTAQSAGIQRINIELYRTDETQIGNLAVTTAVNADAAQAQPQASLNLDVTVHRSTDSEADHVFVQPSKREVSRSLGKLLQRIAASMLLLLLILVVPYAAYHYVLPPSVNDPAVVVSSIEDPLSPQATLLPSEADKYQLKFEQHANYPELVIELTDKAPRNAVLRMSNGRQLNDRAWVIDTKELPTEDGKPVVVAGVVTDFATVDAAKAKEYFEIKKMDQ